MSVRCLIAADGQNARESCAHGLVGSMSDLAVGISAVRDHGCSSRDQHPRPVCLVWTIYSRSHACDVAVMRSGCWPAWYAKPGSVPYQCLKRL